MRPSEIIDRERRLARPAAIAAFGVLIFIIGGVLVSSGSDVARGDNEAEFLRAYALDSPTLALAAVLQGIGFGLAAFPLYYLFKAAEARSDRMRSGLIGIAVAGPIFLALAIVLQAYAYDAIAVDFFEATPTPCTGAEFDTAVSADTCVEDLIAEDSLYAISGGITLAGSLALVFGMIYTSLNAMRVGLLTRFLGTLGMAVGVASLFFGPLFVVLYMIALGFLFLGVAPGGKPPAWDAGEAIPWPSPGQQRADQAEPEAVEGRADEIFPEAADDDGSEPEQLEPGSIADEVDKASRKDEGSGPQKRKRRS